MFQLYFDDLAAWLRWSEMSAATVESHEWRRTDPPQGGFGDKFFMFSPAQYLASFGDAHF